MKPERVGMSAARMSRIKDAVARHVGDDALSGAVTLLARRGEVVHFAAAGLMDRERGVAMRPDAIFRIYSMTKPVTCAALMILYEQGRLQIFDPVATYLPRFGSVMVWNGKTGAESDVVKPARPITIRDLLTHTSGLTYPFNEDGPVEQRYRDMGDWSTPSLAELIDRIAELPLAYQPGTRWRYSVSQDVIARVIEVVSGTSFGEFLRANLFPPLGMGDTGFDVAPGSRDRLVAMHGTRDLEETDMTGTAWMESAAASARHLLADPRDLSRGATPAVHRGGHGLYSTAEDYHAFCRMLLDGGTFRGDRILGRKSVELMTANQLSDRIRQPAACFDIPGCGYGFGVKILLDLGQCQTLGSPGEFSWGGAASTEFWVDPRERMIGIQLAQFMPGGLHRLDKDFRVAAYQAIED